MATAATASAVPMRQASPFHYQATHSSGNAKAAEALFDALASSSTEGSGGAPQPPPASNLAASATAAPLPATVATTAATDSAATPLQVHVQQLPTPRTSFSSSGTASPPDNMSPGSRQNIQHQHHHQPSFPHQSSSASSLFATPASTVPSTIASSLAPTPNPTADSLFAATTGDSSSSSSFAASSSTTTHHTHVNIAATFGQTPSLPSLRATTPVGGSSGAFASSSAAGSSSTLAAPFSSLPLERGLNSLGTMSANHPPSYLSERYPTAHSNNNNSNLSNNGKGAYAYADTSATSAMPAQAYAPVVLATEDEQLLYDQQEQQKKNARPALHGLTAILPPSLNHSLSNAIHSVNTMIDDRRDASFSLPTSSSGVATRSASWSGMTKKIYKASKLPALCLLWYLSSAVTNNIGKQIMNQFRYPVTLTFIQFVFVSLFCFLSGSVLRLTDIRRPTIGIIQMTAPLVGFQVVGHVFSSIAISRVPLSVVHTIKALSPLFTVMFYRFLLGTTYSRSVYLSLVPLTAGVMLACRLSLEFNNLVGLVCALFSCLVFVTQNVFTKRILFSAKSKAGSSTGGLGNKEAIGEEASGGQNAQKLDKINILFYSSTMAAICMVPIWLYAEGFGLLFPEEALAFHHASGHSGAMGIAWLLFLNGVSHYFQNIFAFSVLSLTSPVTYSIASLIKRIIVIVASIVYFRQTLGVTQWTGVCMTFWGLWLYNSAKNASKQGGGAAEGSGPFKLKMGRRTSNAGASGGLLGSWSTGSGGSLPFTSSSADGVARLSDWKSQQQQHRYGGQHAWQS
ncbi:suppressor of loss of ypt1 [Actinomortierella ambigua]|nr:suppressor of loss of ypt1 [Actinomortierella ambigua]